MKKNRYFLGRVHKLGRLTDELLIEAIVKPKIFHARDYSWSFSETSTKKSGNTILYVYSELCKYDPQGSIRVMNEERHSQDEKNEPNLIKAASRFIYIPEFSGIAYQHIWNLIEKKAFISSFSGVVKNTHDNFFVNCEIEPITDLGKFYQRLARIKDIIEIKSNINPPNPLFGKAWKELKDYIIRRSVSELNMQEKGRENKPIQSKIAEHIRNILDTETAENYEPDEPIDITDAAILMAADGYGSGKVVGKVGDTTTTISTSENQTSFFIDADISPELLYKEAYKNFERINITRNLGHE